MTLVFGTTDGVSEMAVGILWLDVIKHVLIRMLAYLARAAMVDDCSFPF